MSRMYSLYSMKRILLFSLILVFQLINLSLAQTLLDATTHPKFINPLPIPTQIDATQGGSFEMEMNQTQQWLGLVDPLGQPLMTKVWGYGLDGVGVTYPGPTFMAKRDVQVNVNWHNRLPAHFLPVDPTLHMAHPGTLHTPEEVAAWYADGNVPTVAHLHGGHTESASDGLPEAWYTQGGNETGAYYVKQNYTYDNSQEAATLWYHDHALGITRLNVYAGLAGFYLLEDQIERDLVKNNVLPKGKHDVEIVIQDRMFDDTGQLFLPSKTGDPWFGDPDEPLELPYDPSIVAEFFGDFIVVNGQVWPYLSVEPRPYRFRLLNGSDSRFYVLRFEGDQEFLQIATDDGLLPQAVALTELIIAPGERAEIVVDFNEVGFGNNILLKNYGPDEPFKGKSAGQTPADPLTTGLVMQFKVDQKRI
ncbi:MAG: multicopper oxidase domain-containing protein [Calditrichaceae bacterium]